MTPPLRQADARLPDNNIVVVLLTIVGVLCCLAAPTLFMYNDAHIHVAVKSTIPILFAAAFYMTSVVVHNEYSDKRTGCFRGTPHHWVAFIFRMFFLATSLTVTSFFNITEAGIIGYCCVAVGTFCMLMIVQPSFDGGLLQATCVLPIQALRQHNTASKLSHAETGHYYNATPYFIVMGIVSLLILATQHYYFGAYDADRSEKTVNNSAQPPRTEQQDQGQI